MPHKFIEEKIVVSIIVEGTGPFGKRKANLLGR